MLSIGVLGFIVWAHMGLSASNCVTRAGLPARRLSYMLENTFAKVQSAGNYIKYYTLLCLSKSTLIIFSFFFIIFNLTTFAGLNINFPKVTFGNATYCLPRKAWWMVRGSIGSPETTRLISSTHSLIRTFHDPAAFLLSSTAAYSSYNYPDWFEDWFVGFAEGDGGFYVDLKTKRFYFKIRQKNPQVLYLIRNYFNFGSIFKSEDGYYSFSVQAKDHIFRLLSIFNGKLLLNKTNSQFLNNWFLNYNRWYDNNLLVYKDKPVFTNETFFKNAWLCGFTDADGSLGFKLLSDPSRTASGGKRLRVYWYIDQVDEIQALSLIQNFLFFCRLENKSPYIHQYPGTRTELAYRLMVDSLSGCKILHNYFDNYNPQTTKLRVRWIRWKLILTYLQSRDWKHRLAEIRHLINLNRDL